MREGDAQGLPLLWVAKENRSLVPLGPPSWGSSPSRWEREREEREREREREKEERERERERGESERER